MVPYWGSGWMLARIHASYGSNVSNGNNTFKLMKRDGSGNISQIGSSWTHGTSREVSAYINSSPFESGGQGDVIFVSLVNSDAALGAKGYTITVKWEKVGSECDHTTFPM